MLTTVISDVIAVASEGISDSVKSVGFDLISYSVVEQKIKVHLQVIFHVGYMKFCNWF